MDASTIAARIASGYARGAGVIGLPYTQYRPTEATAPMAAPLGTVAAAFKPSGKNFGAPNKPDNAWFDGCMDTTLVEPGDILVGPAGTFFVWRLPTFGAALAVECNATATVVRPAQPAAAGFNDLGATPATNQLTLLQGWPASIRRDGRGERSDADLPGTGRVGNWVVLLPAFAGVTFLVADVVERSLDNARLLVSLAELTDAWRLIAQEEFDLMASLRQVAQAIAQLAATACYPNGTAAPSITGAVVRTAADDPRSAQLDQDLQAGNAFVRVTPRPNVSRQLPVSLMGEQDLPVPAPTLTATVAANTVTLGGTVTPAWPVAVIVNGVAVAYAPTATDTLPSIAAALAGLIEGASAAGATLTIPGAWSVAANCVSSGNTLLALIRQVQGFIVTIFAPGVDVRETIGVAVKLAIVQTPRLLLPDGTIGLMRWTAEWDNNKPGKELDFERTILCQVEYDTVNIAAAWQIGATIANAAP